MCMICIEFLDGRLTRYEAASALSEMIETETIEIEHAFEVSDLIEQIKGEGERDER